MKVLQLHAIYTLSAALSTDDGAVARKGFYPKKKARKLWPKAFEFRKIS